LARLVLLNGAPGAGKTSLARRLVVEHPLALLVDIDGLRTQLGQWDSRAESRGIARMLALALSEAHLSAGHDVVIPQYVGRLEFVEQLASLAHRCGAEFLEVVLVTDANVAMERFRARRAEHESSGTAHPEVDVSDADIDRVVLEAIDQLEGICDRRPDTRRVPANSNLEETYTALLTLIEAETR
jgi:predicted kinase